MSQSASPHPHPIYDRDIIAGEVAWVDECECGHNRVEHMAATGALGSFGGSACEMCWTCATFRKAGPLR